MNPIVLISLLAAGCAAAPATLLHHALPLGGLVATHSITHQVPSAVELKQVGDVVPVAAPLAHVAVPGYTVNGEIRTVAAADLPEVPLVAHTGVIAHAGLIHPLAVAPAVVKADEEDKTVAVLPTLAGLPAIHHAGLPIAYHGLGLHGLGLHGLPLIAAAAPAAEETEE